MRNRGIGSVAITGADGQVGRALLERLRDTPVRAIALARKNVRLPADRLVVGPLDTPAAAAAMAEADLVVHLAGALRPLGGNSYRSANLDTTQAVARAISGGNPRRVLFLSYVGASDRSKNEYLRTKALAERALAASGRGLVVFRCAHIVGPPEAPGPTALAMLARPGKEVRVLGNGRQTVAPVYVGDVASALLAALQGGAPGTYDLAGPERMLMDNLVRLVNRDPRVSIAHLPAPLARLFSRFVPSLPGAMVDVLLRDSVGDPTRAVAAFGLRLTSLRAIWGSDAPVNPRDGAASLKQRRA